MSALLRWLMARPTREQYWKLLTCAVAFQILWTVAAGSFIVAFDLIPQGPAFSEGGRPPFIAVIMFFIAAAFIEEVMYRLVPLAAALLLFGWSAYTRPLILVVAVIVSIDFALAHGDGEWARLLLQGVYGLLWSIVFLKVSSMQFKYFFGAFGSVWLLHTLWNVGLVGLELTLRSLPTPF